MGICTDLLPAEARRQRREVLRDLGEQRERVRGGHDALGGLKA